ncbi:alpha/beta hydrolase [Longimicrobium sp.]|uniref:alpha/beta fold hydrolase n=1 Tax=Longimicrobium sp. TaxID=2029185 RepID=UPI002E34F4E5|nr:alpha/beta hydrolase [Longimicrobium sp.]HEX6040475.1 alpha/beta hydrolase [Longimicrobium sp.]
MDFLEIDGTRLECRWIGPGPEEAPTIVFLHEGLGAVSTWRDFPDALAAATGCGALVYSRAGYGRSDPVALPRPVRFMHDEAEVLAKVVERAGLRDVILLGHSDGASIALIAAGRRAIPDLRAIVLEAPHVFAEPCGLESIARIAETYQTTNLRAKLERHHGANVDVAFRGWNGVWLDPEFRAWNIEAFLPGIAVPALVVQGENDEYGSWAHVESIERRSGGPVRTLAVPDCGHAPHAEQRDLVLGAMADFIRGILTG